MLIPENRLIFWAAAILIPFAIAGAGGPATFTASALIIGAFLVVVIADAFTAPARLRGLRVELPPLQRLQKDFPGDLDLHIVNERRKVREVRIGLSLPREITTPSLDRMVRLPADADSAHFVWTCTPRRRGQYWLREARLEVRSVLGFWAARSTQPVSMELRVYPNLREERRQLSALFLRRQQLGEHRYRAAGQGREFEKLRDYVPGDSLSDIHWKVTAKRGRPVTKVYRVEQSHEVYVVIDASRLSARAARPVPVLAGEEESHPPGGLVADAEGKIPASVLEHSVSAALVLALAAEQQGDQFGIITFSDRVTTFLRARSGQSHYDTVRDRLYALHAESVSPDFEELCTTIRLRLRKRALLIFLTSLDDPVLADSFTKATDLLSRQHLLFVNMLAPAGAQPLFSDPEGVAEVGDLYDRLGGHLRWHALKELQLVLQRRGVRLSLIDPDRLALELVAQHAEARSRQMI